MNKKLLSLYSLKFNPFSPEVPTSALWVFRPESQVLFSIVAALVTGCDWVISAGRCGRQVRASQSDARDHRRFGALRISPGNGRNR